MANLLTLGYLFQIATCFVSIFLHIIAYQLDGFHKRGEIAALSITAVVTSAYLIDFAMHMHDKLVILEAIMNLGLLGLESAVYIIKDEDRKNGKSFQDMDRVKHLSTARVVVSCVVTVLTLLKATVFIAKTWARLRGIAIENNFAEDIFVTDGAIPHFECRNCHAPAPSGNGLDEDEEELPQEVRVAFATLSKSFMIVTTSHLESFNTTEALLRRIVMGPLGKGTFIVRLFSSRKKNAWRRMSSLTLQEAKALLKVKSEELNNYSDFFDLYKSAFLKKGLSFKSQTVSKQEFWNKVNAIWSYVITPEEREDMKSLYLRVVKGRAPLDEMPPFWRLCQKKKFELWLKHRNLTRPDAAELYIKKMRKILPAEQPVEVEVVLPAEQPVEV